ncbi:hypothetical protein H8356DRAFT_1346121 [Neocallimastix lanati (nom. inval.)]|nr:hypothetical protein H8356DRAFT_1327943 [Neocallimastix sp. JGI-2020a]KAG4100200.1 hypothetical protein H8356DRAFT_1346121 [Neocallimastix sp. JGI-2020a]
MRNSNVIGKSFSGDHSLRNIIKLTSKNKKIYTNETTLLLIKVFWTVFPGVLITAFCDSDDNQWLSFLKWLLVRREKSGILEDCRK